MTKPTALALGLVGVVGVLWAFAAQDMTAGARTTAPRPSVEFEFDDSRAPSLSASGKQPSLAIPRDPGLPLGQFEVLSEGDGLRVRANQAPRAAVLQRLADVAQVTMTVRADLSGTVSADLPASPLSQVVQELVAELPFSLEYRFDAERSRHVPESLFVGPRDAVVESEIEDAEEDGSPQTVASVGAPAGDSNVSPTYAARQLREARYASVLETRVRADESEPDFAPNALNSKHLLELLASDSNDQVRAAAAYQLGGASELMAAKQGLLRALSDRNASVVVQALESLAEHGDPSVVPEMRAAVSKSAAPSVHAALANAEDKLESAPLVHVDDSVHHASQP